METCKQQQERIEETVLQPLDKWVETQEQKCKNEPCNWWTLCLNKLVCWILVSLVKITLWITQILVRWVYRTVCTLVTLAVGLVFLLFGNTAIIQQALLDFWELIKDVFYASVGTVIYAALLIVDTIQSVFGIQQKKRSLTEQERAILRKIFRNSLNYNAISIIGGNAGLLGISGHPFTMGFNVYIPTYSITTLVHECVHVWQFQFEGTKYIGNSAFNQLDSIIFSKGYQPYSWVGPISGETNSWYTLKSVEAQAQFIEDVFVKGQFIANDKPSDTTPGAFFKEGEEKGHNKFEYNEKDYTSIANDAWRIIRTG